MTTTKLMAEILARPGIANVRPIAPNRHRGTLLRITTDGFDGNGKAIYSDFTLAEARAWMAACEVCGGPEADHGVTNGYHGKHAFA